MSTKKGMNTVTFLNPFFTDLPLVAHSGTGINYETLASRNPDVVFLRVGSSTPSLDPLQLRFLINIPMMIGHPVIPRIKNITNWISIFKWRGSKRTKGSGTQMRTRQV